MSLVIDYDSSDDGGQTQSLSGTNLLDAAPSVNQQQIQVKSKISPSNPTPERNILTGHVQAQALDRNVFELQRRVHFQHDNEPPKKRAKGEVGVVSGENAYKGPWAKYDSDSESDVYVSEEEEEERSGGESQIDAAHLDVHSEDDEPAQIIIDHTSSKIETSQFHASRQMDYLGRTYMHVPQDLGFSLKKDRESIECRLPRHTAPEHTWKKAHEGSVTVLALFPVSGHLLLSGGSDGVVRLWDVFRGRELLRSFHGHSKGITSLAFSPDGKTFLSASLDGYVKLWDLESGECRNRYNYYTTKLKESGQQSGTGRKGVTCVLINPRHPRQFIAGMQNNRIARWNMDSGQIMQEYNHHLGAVISLALVDQNFRFLSTSDDKTVRIWDWDINVPVKYIAGAHQHAMPSVACHPSGKYVALQSLDNRIIVLGATEQFKSYKNRVFEGFNGGGYAVGLDITADGQFLAAGDAGGYVVIWSWRDHRTLTKIKAHKKLVTSIVAHPQLPTGLISAGVDSSIHLWT